MGRNVHVFWGSQERGATAAAPYSPTGSAKRNRAYRLFYLRDALDRLPVIAHNPRLVPHLHKAYPAGPLSEGQRSRLQVCDRPSQYLDIFRRHTRWLADAFLFPSLASVAAGSPPPSPGNDWLIQTDQVRDFLPWRGAQQNCARCRAARTNPFSRVRELSSCSMLSTPLYPAIRK